MLWWVQKAFRLSQIREVVFDVADDQYKRITIITKDFKNHSFLAASLKKKNWEAFQQRLQEEGINLRNKWEF